jgi:hypothetical protein
MSQPIARALDGVRLGISISESDGSQGRGFDAEEVNRTVERLCLGLLAQGAGLVFGHDWRAGGVMERVLGFAQGYQRPGGGEPLLLNLIPWPEAPALSQQERDFLGDVLKIEQCGLPPALAGEVESGLRGQPGGQAYLRARALTWLRRALTDRCTARVCLGGKTRGYQGRLPGIVEEGLFALEFDRPLFLSAIFGGATADLIDALAGRPLAVDGWQPAEGIVQSFAAFGAGVEPGDPDARLDPAGVRQRLAGLGLAQLARDNGLSPEENGRLFRAQSASEVIDWILVGLARLGARPGDGSNGRALLGP